MKMAPLKRLENLLQNNRLQEVFDYLLNSKIIKLTRNERGQIINLSARYSKVNDSYRKGIITSSEFFLEENKIREALSQIIHKLTIHVESENSEAQSAQKYYSGKLRLYILTAFCILIIFAVSTVISQKNISIRNKGVMVLKCSFQNGGDSTRVVEFRLISQKQTHLENIVLGLDSIKKEDIPLSFFDEFLSVQLILNEDGERRLFIDSVKIRERINDTLKFNFSDFKLIHSESPKIETKIIKNKEDSRNYRNLIMVTEPSGASCPEFENAIKRILGNRDIIVSTFKEAKPFINSRGEINPLPENLIKNVIIKGILDLDTLKTTGKFKKSAIDLELKFQIEISHFQSKQIFFSNNYSLYKASSIRYLERDKKDLYNDLLDSLSVKINSLDIW